MNSSPLPKSLKLFLLQEKVLCGLEHGFLRLELIVEDFSDYLVGVNIHHNDFIGVATQE